MSADPNRRGERGRSAKPPPALEGEDKAVWLCKGCWEGCGML